MRHIAHPVYLFGIISVILISGCAGSPIRTGWQAESTKQGLLKLQEGMAPNQVIDILGKPEKTEMYKGSQGQTVLVYMYIAEGMDFQTRTWNEGNYMPVIFENNKVSAWGWSALNSTAQKYEFVIKNR